GIYPYLAPLVNSITAALAPIEEKAAASGAKIGELIGPALQHVTEMLNSGINLAPFAQLLSFLSPIGIAFKVLEPVLPVITDAFQQIGAAIGGALIGAVQTLVPVIAQVAQVFSG